MVAIFLLGFASLFPAFFDDSSAAADRPQIHGAPLDELTDFFEFTDHDGVIHFVDSPEKIPHRYRSKAIVRKEIPAARQTTKIVVSDSQIHVPVTLRIGGNAVQAVMLLDTGASITCITEELAARLNFGSENTRPATTRLADGSEIAIRLAKLDSLSVGTMTQAPLQIGIMLHRGSPEMHDGLLGLDFLAHFQYQVDLPNQIIHWQ